MRLDGKVAIVTGSCQGIGAAIALELSSYGASIVLNYPFHSQKQQAETILAQLKSPGMAVEADLSTLEGPQKLVSEAVSHFHEIDILVNNASVAIFKPLELCTPKDWEDMVNLNGRGYLLTTQAVLPYLRKGHSTRIINITSSDAQFPTIDHSIYAGTKGMQESLTRSWAKELPPKYGCTVNSVVPGPTRYLSDG
jgi:NAD(P)-dependent dehydrogenase (short-subunit alcohol dehydrogenase family)